MKKTLHPQTVSDAPSVHVDPFSGSLGHLLALSFVPSRSPSFPLALNVAKGATIYSEAKVDKQIVHLAVFAKTRDDAGRALAILEFLSGSKNLRAYVQGKLLPSPFYVRRVLECYLDASGCSDYTAHCHKIIDDPFSFVDQPRSFSTGISINLSATNAEEKPVPPVDRYLFPCSYLNQRFRFQPDHPSSSIDQIQAGAVEHGCNWCPLFDPNHFRKVGTRMTVNGKSFTVHEA